MGLLSRNTHVMLWMNDLTVSCMTRKDELKLLVDLYSFYFLWEKPNCTTLFFPFFFFFFFVTTAVPDSCWTRHDFAVVQSCGQFARQCSPHHTQTHSLDCTNHMLLFWELLVSLFLFIESAKKRAHTNERDLIQNMGSRYGVRMCHGLK